MYSIEHLRGISEDPFLVNTIFSLRGISFTSFWRIKGPSRESHPYSDPTAGCIVVAVTCWSMVVFPLKLSLQGFSWIVASVSEEKDPR